MTEAEFKKKLAALSRNCLRLSAHPGDPGPELISQPQPLPSASWSFKLLSRTVFGMQESISYGVKRLAREEDHEAQNIMLNSRGGRRHDLRFAALGGVAGPVLFTIVMLICAGLRPDYSHVSQFMSELGATGTPNAQLMNYAAFLPGGTLLAVFGLSIAILVSRHPLSIVASGLLTLFGAGVAAAGFFSCDPGCPQAGGSLQNLIHDRLGPLSFLSAIVAVGLLAVHFRRLGEWQSVWVYSAISSLVAFLSLVLLASSLESRDLTGLWQRLLVGTLYTWCAVIGLRAFRLSRRTSGLELQG